MSNEVATPTSCAAAETFDIHRVKRVTFKETPAMLSPVHGSPIPNDNVALHHMAADEDGASGERRVIDYDGRHESSNDSEIETGRLPDAKGLVSASLDEVSESDEETEEEHLRRINTQELWPRSTDEMNAKNWKEARYLLEEAIERIKEEARSRVLDYQLNEEGKKSDPTVEDDGFDLLPVLGKYYVRLAIACLKEMASQDLLSAAGNGEESGLALDELAHISLEFARKIYGFRMDSLLEPTGDDLCRMATDLRVRIDQEGPLLAKDEWNVLAIFSKLILWDGPMSPLTDQLPLLKDLVRESLQCSIRAAELEDHKTDFKMARDSVLHNLLVMVIHGIRGPQLRELMYDLQHYLSITGFHKTATSCANLMTKWFSQISLAQPKDYAVLWIDRPEDCDEAREICDELMNIHAQAVKRMQETETNGDETATASSSNSVTQALMQALGDVDAGQSGTFTGFESSTLLPEEQQIKEVIVRKKRPREKLEAADDETQVEKKKVLTFITEEKNLSPK